MSQYRYHNYEAPLVSIDENNRLVGLAFPGTYAGFDTIEVVSGSTLKIKHTKTGAKRLKEDGTVDEGPFGVIVSRQGTVVYDDAEVEFGIPFITTNPRMDIIVAQHTHLDSPGGSSMTYSRIAGAEAVNPIPPSLTNPLIQVLIGYIKVYSTTDHTSTIFIPVERKTLGGLYPFGTKQNEVALRHAEEEDFDKIYKSGVYTLHSTTNAPSAGANNRWALMVFHKNTLSENMAQLAINLVQGRVYIRAAATLTGEGIPLTWGPWSSLNNVEVPGVDLTPLLVAIGSRIYTEQNAVTTGESLTESIDALDTFLGSVGLDVDNLNTTVFNIQQELNSVFSSITSAIHNIDNATVASVRYVRRQGGSTGTYPPGTGSSTQQLIVTRGNYLIAGPTLVEEVTQQLFDFASGAIWTRGSNNNGASWSTWTIRKFGQKTIEITSWNMDTTVTKAVPHGLGDITKIRDVKIMIQNDAGTEVEHFFGRKNFSNNQERVGGIYSIDATNIELARADSASGGIFDSADFSGSGTRGYITIEYIPFD